MREYKMADFALMYQALIVSLRDLNTADTLKQSITNDDEWCKRLGIALEGLAIVCRNFEADNSLAIQIDTISKGLMNGATDLREAVLAARLEAIVDGIHHNLGSRKFTFIPSNQANYWNNVSIFGDDWLITKPPSTVVLDAMEAGNCFAAGRWTASVFHCMRVAEHTLRQLARKLKVTISDKGKKCPLEYGDWNKVITGIRGKLTDLRRLPAGPRREKALQFYSAAADQCEYMKDVWRNEVSHTRRHYKEEEALRVIRRLRDFVQMVFEKDAEAKIKERARRLQTNARFSTLRQLLATKGPVEGEQKS